MRDGVHLSAKSFARPVLVAIRLILLRTPYNKGDDSAEFQSL